MIACPSRPAAVFSFLALALAALTPLSAVESASGSRPVPPQPVPSLQTLPQNGVTALASSADGKWLAAGGEEGRLRLWDLRTLSLRDSARLSHGAIKTVRFSADGSRLLVLDDLGTARFCDVSQGQIQYRVAFDRSSELAFSPDGNRAYSVDTGGRLWSLYWTREGKRLDKSTPAYERAASSLQVFDEGRYLATVGDENAIHLWETANLKLAATIGVPDKSTPLLAVTSNGSMLAAGGRDGVVRVWPLRLPSGKSSFTVGPVRMFGTSTGAVRALAFSGDGSLLAAADEAGNLRVSDSSSGAQLHSFRAHAGPVRGVAFLRASVPLSAGQAYGTVITCGADSAVRFWDLRTGALQRSLLGFNGVIEDLAYAPDGKTLASVHGDRRLRLWDPAKPELKRVFPPHRELIHALAFSPGGEMVATGGGALLQEIHLWSASAGTEIRDFPKLFGPCYKLAFSPDGRLLASGSYQVTRVYRVSDGQLLRILTGHEDRVNTLQFSPDGQSLVTGSLDGTLRSWNCETWALGPTFSVAPARVYSLVHSPDGRVIVFGAKGQTLVLDAKTLQVIQREREAGAVYAFSANGKRLSAGFSARDDVSVWDYEAGKLSNYRLLELKAGPWVAPSPDGRMIAASDDTLISFADTTTGKFLGELAAVPVPDSPPAGAGGSIETPTDYLFVAESGYFTGSDGGRELLRYTVGQRSFPSESYEGVFRRPDEIRALFAGRVLQPPTLRGPFPPRVFFTSPSTDLRMSGSRLRVSLDAEDDRSVAGVELRVNGKLIYDRHGAVRTARNPPESRKPIRAGSKPLRVGSKPLRVGSKPLRVGSKPLRVGSKPLRVGSETLPQVSTPEATPRRDPYSTSRTFSFEVPLPATSVPIKIGAVAYDDEGLKSPEQSLQVIRADLRRPTGRLTGLCVGISRYAASRLNLRYASSDAAALAHELNRQAKLPSGLYAGGSVSLLKDSAATRTGLSAALDRLLATSKAEDTVVLFLSGHGWRDENGQFYFATHEVQRDRPEETAVSWHTLSAMLTRLSRKTRRVLVLLDACHSGSTANHEELLRELVTARTGALVLASSRSAELSLESDAVSGGLFARALVEGFRGGGLSAGGHEVTVLDLLSYVSRRVRSLSGDRQHPHVPLLQNLETDAPLALKR